MKRFIATCLFVLVTASASLAGDHVEVGSVTTYYGAHVIATYLVVNGSYREVDLVWPDGHVDRIAVESGTPAKIMNRALQRFVDAQEAH